MKLLQDTKKIHIVGIKGWGTSALAQLLAKKGHAVCGSDHPTYFKTQDILAQTPGIHIEEFSETLHADVDLVIYSTGFPLTHPELTAAQQRGIPCYAYPDALAVLFNDSRGIAIAGTHGKTTTSAWLATTLSRLNLDPTAIIGGWVRDFGTNVRVGASDIFVLEADEYQDKLAFYQPMLAVITSIDFDHPDFFPTEEIYRQTFRKFSESCVKRGRPVIACAEHEGVRETLADMASSLIWYGFDESLPYAASNIQFKDDKSYFDIVKSGTKVGQCAISLVGRHNILNALAVFAVADQLLEGSKTTELCAAISDFMGTGRRFEYRQPIGSALVIDDFAHHPVEVAATLSAARERYPEKKIWCVFRPHTFTRTRELLTEFAESFSAVDRVIVTDIYGSVREESGGIHARDLVEGILHNGGDAVYGGSIANVLEYIMENDGACDVLITMGAEDMWKEWDLLLSQQAKLITEAS